MYSHSIYLAITERWIIWDSFSPLFFIYLLTIEFFVISANEKKNQFYTYELWTLPVIHHPIELLEF